MKDSILNIFPRDWDTKFCIIHNGKMYNVKCTSVTVTGDRRRERVTVNLYNHKHRKRISVVVAERRFDEDEPRLFYPHVWRSVEEYQREQLNSIDDVHGGKDHCWKSLFEETLISCVSNTALKENGVSFSVELRDDVRAWYPNSKVHCRYAFVNGEVVPVILERQPRTLIVKRDKGIVSCEAFCDDNTYGSREECLSVNMPEIVEWK